MPDTKTCEVCGKSFPKTPNLSRATWEVRRFCSMACKGASQRGKPSGASGKKYDRPKRFLPCRICGEPTRYAGVAGRHAGMVRCDRPECVEASRLLKNERIGAVAREKYANGQRQPARHTWTGVSRVSPEETALAPLLAARGWVAQYRFNTGVHSNKLPRQFRLDFAMPDRRLYVEIDGDVHRLRRDRDARRDAMMAERGWRGLRLPASLVRDNPDSAVHRIDSWLDDSSS